MVLVHNSDTFKVKVMTLIANYDHDTLINLYQPLIGYAAVALYFSLLAEAENQKIEPLTKHESILVKTQLSQGEFIKARKALEGIGLLKTKVKENEEGKTFFYSVYAPKTPNDFFNDVLLCGLLNKYIGETETNRYKSIYKINDSEVSGNDISASFSEVFHPNFEDPIFLKALNKNKAKGRNFAKIESTFSYEKLIEELAKISSINEKSLSKEEVKEISRLATLYAINEEEAAPIVASLYNPNKIKGQRVNFDLLTSTFEENTAYSYLSKKSAKSDGPKVVSSRGDKLSSKINLFERITPKELLYVLQNGSKPATPDLKLIDDISANFHLNNAVINALIDYVLTTNNNILSKPYCEKVAASLAREGITSAVDAMDYLNSTNKLKKKASKGVNKETNNIKNKDIKEDKFFEDDGRTLKDLMQEFEGDVDNGEA